jgi:hypothetical protein
MPEAIELYKKDGTSAGAFYCSECRAMFGSEEQASGCHGERICECGKPIDRRYYAICSECSDTKFRTEQAEKERQRFEKAEKVPYADYEGGMLFDGDKYHDDLESLEDDVFDGDMPEYVWACKDIGVIKATTENLYENMLENMWEDADVSDLCGVDELEAAVTAFNEANAGIHVWEPDYSTAILVERTEVL